MLHTLLITNRIIENSTYQIIYNKLEEISKKKGEHLYPKCKTKTKKEYITNALKDEGFTEIRLLKKSVDKKYNYPYMQISILLNPTKLLGRDIVELTEEKDIPLISEKFNKRIDDIHVLLPRFLGWTVNRIDYAKNIKVENVDKYIELFQRADKPKNFVEMYDKENHRQVQKEGSYYIFSYVNNKKKKKEEPNVIINFYDKFDERLKNAKNIVPSAKNILRLEIQCSKTKTDYIKEKYGWETKYLVNYLKEELSNEIISYYYKNTIGAGDYYSLTKAKELINNSSHQTRTKEILVDILERINSAKSIWKVREKNIYPKEDFNRYLRLIRALEVNPVTIPRRWNIEKLDNIYKF